MVKANGGGQARRRRTQRYRVCGSTVPCRMHPVADLVRWGFDAAPHATPSRPTLNAQRLNTYAHPQPLPHHPPPPPNFRYTLRPLKPWTPAFKAGELQFAGIDMRYHGRAMEVAAAAFLALPMELLTLTVTSTILFWRLPTTLEALFVPPRHPSECVDLHSTATPPHRLTAPPLYRSTAHTAKSSFTNRLSSCARYHHHV